MRRPLCLFAKMKRNKTEPALSQHERGIANKSWLAFFFSLVFFCDDFFVALLHFFIFFLSLFVPSFASRPQQNNNATTPPTTNKHPPPPPPPTTTMADLALAQLTCAARALATEARSRGARASDAAEALRAAEEKESVG